MLSVIVPIYNTSKYLSRCLDSLFAQTIDEIEYIFVDDASTDDSLSLYPERLSRCKVIRHADNLGLPKTRADGVACAKGTYVIHCDSDDWVSPNMYKEMYETAIIGDYDIVSCGYIQVTGNDSIPYNVPFPNNITRILSLVLQGKLHSSLCNKMVKRKLYENIITPQGAMLEDMTVFIQLLLKSKSWYSLSQNYYYYRNNPSSIVKKHSLQSALSRYNDSIENVSIILSCIQANQLSSSLKNEIICLKHFAKLSLWPYIDRRDVYLLWKRTYPEVNYAYLRTSGVKTKFKLIHFFSVIGVYPWIKRVLSQCK